MKVKKITKNITVSITTAILAVFCSITAFAADNDGWSNLISMGDNLATNIQKILKVIAMIAVGILAIMIVSGGREWTQRLKSGAAGIIVGVAIGCYGGSIVAGVFA